MRSLLFRKENVFVVIILLLVTVVLNNVIFSNQLNYGFRDVDWQVLYFFKFFGNLSVNHLFQVVRAVGVYAFESYYVGFLVNIFGINFADLHKVTQVLKILSALFIFILVLRIFESRLLAFITSVLYSISYTHAGVLFQLASGGYFLTIIFMILFLLSYYYSLLRRNSLKWTITTSILLAISLILKPERMYPLVFLIIFVEFFKMIKDGFSKKLIFNSSKRALVILLPLIIFSFFFRTLFNNGNLHFGPDQFSISANIRLTSIIKGNLQLLLYPFASLGSIFLYGDYWKLFGKLDFQSFGSYVTSLIFGPIMRIGIFTSIFLHFIYKKSFKLILIISSLVFVFGISIYAMNINWQHVDKSVRIHFDPNLIAIPAVFGFYIFMLNVLFFITWIKTKDRMLTPLVLGFIFAAVFIFLTWIPSDLQLLFMGPQRYLSIPSIGTSLFTAGLLVLIFNRLLKIGFAKKFAWTVFLVIFPLVIINYRVASEFFNYELTYAGLRGSEQTRMKNDLRRLTGTISTTDASLFYFDETADKENGYFDEGTTIAGFESWIRVNMDGSLNNFPEPGQMRTSIQCSEHTHQNCVSILKEGLEVINGKKGIWYKDPIRGNKNQFYYLENFHAFRFLNKDIVDIRDEVFKEMDLTESSL